MEIAFENKCANHPCYGQISSSLHGKGGVCSHTAIQFFVPLHYSHAPLLDKSKQCLSKLHNYLFLFPSPPADLPGFCVEIWQGVTTGNQSYIYSPGSPPLQL